MNTAEEHTICIGAGPAGLTAAYELTRAHKPVTVLEADSTYVGGIARTITQDGFCFDIGGHRFFSKSPEIMQWWKDMLGPELLTRPRKSRIFYGGKFYPYPLELLPTLRNLGMVESLRCLLSYMEAKLFPVVDPRNLEEWVTNQFGQRLFRMFFKTYTEKVWGMPCRDIAADWAAQRIKGLSFSSALKNAALGTLGIKNRGSIKTLIEEFLYPRLGPGQMWEETARKIQSGGGEVKLQSPVQALRHDGTLWHVAYGENQHSTARHLISSMPLKELVHAIEGAPDSVKNAANRLAYRDFLIVALVLKDKGGFDDNWIYVHAPEVKVGRIQNFKAWSPDMVKEPGLVCYGLEYFCFEGDGLWASADEDLIQLGVRELAQIGLASAQDVQGGYVVRQRKAYPVYDAGYEENVNIIRSWMDAHCPNLQIVGRNGMHKYNNQDHSMMTAMLAVKNILAGKREYNVWQVNQDAQYLEEKYHEEDKASAGLRLVPRPLA
ncbi:MAG: NAD(P)/FAD-dependent oxidoreductase [Rickettsiales bacterium]|nr:NAD(P)/FAD-dependent oxidoreductase [Rickettsiales bacterium]